MWICETPILEVIFGILSENWCVITNGTLVVTFRRPDVAVGTFFHAQHGTKTGLLYWTVDGEASWLLLWSSVSFLSGSTMGPKNTYYCIFKVPCQVWESQKKYASTLNRATTSIINFSKSVSTDLVFPDLVLQTWHFSRLSWNSRFTMKDLSFSGLMVFIMQSVVIKPGYGNSIMTSLSLYFNLLLLLNWVVQ